MSFLTELRKTTNKTLTENGAVTNISTLHPVLDFFAQAGAMRDRVGDAVKLFKRAYSSDPLLATKALFYLRDVRGGQGERTLFRECLATLPKETVEKNIQCIPEYGRYDDLFALDISFIAPFIDEQLKKDELAMKNKTSVSLLAKWLPSENTSSDKTKQIAKNLTKALKLKPSQYRKRVVTLRKYIDLLEHKMSSNEWGIVNYEKIPSQAMRKHVKAFRRHDEKRFDTYLEEVQQGKKKMKTSTLYTYEVFDTIKNDEAAANAMWVSLPDYTNGQDAIVMADVSGSMDGRPMSVSVSLALYFAERNKGAFHNYFMTFSDQPQVVPVLGNSLVEKLSNIENAHWDGSTDLEAAFVAILNAAKNSGAKGDDIPKILYIISDMQFDHCVANGEMTNLDNAKNMFEEAGYTLPHVVFWNVDSRNDNVPAVFNSGRVTLISGSSQSTFKYALEGKTPLESMHDILNSERYAQITV